MSDRGPLPNDPVHLGELGEGVEVRHDDRPQEALVLAHHHHLVDVLGLEDRLFDRRRLDVLAAQQHDRLLFPADDLDLALAREHGEVARVEPTVGRDDLGGEIRALVVALHHVGPADEEHALPPGAHHVALLVDDLDLDLRHGRADGAGHRRRRRAHRDDRRRLGEAVALQQQYARGGEEAVDVARQGAPARHAKAEAAAEPRAQLAEDQRLAEGVAAG